MRNYVLISNVQSNNFILIKKLLLRLRHVIHIHCCLKIYCRASKFLVVLHLTVSFDKGGNLLPPNQPIHSINNINSKLWLYARILGELKGKIVRPNIFSYIQIYAQFIHAAPLKKIKSLKKFLFQQFIFFKTYSHIKSIFHNHQAYPISR